nr:MAG TPA: hypothetical protein [Caudoviricetes sp.]
MILSIRNHPNPSEESGFIRNHSTIIRTINSRLIEVETAENQRSVKFFARLTHD